MTIWSIAIETEPATIETAFRENAPIQMQRALKDPAVRDEAQDRQYKSCHHKDKP
jgi:hypothetical protein